MGINTIAYVEMKTASEVCEDQENLTTEVRVYECRMLNKIYDRVKDMMDLDSIVTTYRRLLGGETG